jgi:RNA polymerase sigma-70 factor (sigma-E family)
MADDLGGFSGFAAAQSRPLMRAALALTSDFHAAQDLVQETLVRMFENWARVRGDLIESPEAYAKVVLVRTYVSQRRKRSSWEKPLGIAADGPEEADDPALRVDMAKALATLRAKDRAVLVLRFLCDRSVEQVAADLGISPGNVRSQTKRALERLRAVIGQAALLESCPVDDAYSA